jgi:DNA end-binding protein Ku
MAPRTFWKGYLKLSLVTCPVQMVPATTDDEKVKFHTLNRETGNRVVSRYVDAESGKPVADEDQVKGYQRGEEEYVELEDDEIDAVALDSTRTIDVETFVPQESIEWIWYDKPHYLLPADDVGEEAFCVIRDAMAATRTGGISRLVMYRRERAVLLLPHDNGIVLWTLRYGDEVRDATPYFADVKPAKPERKLVDLVQQLIKERSKPWDSDMVHDPVQERLLDIVASKRKGKRPPKMAKEEEPERPSNVISIVDALKKSLAAEGKRGRKR